MELLDIKKYVEEDNEFYNRYPEAKRLPMIYQGRRFIINDNKILYYIVIYTSVVVSAPYTPSYHNYILVENENAKKIDLNDDYFQLSNLYISDNRICLYGSHCLNWHNNYAITYMLDEEGNAAAINDMLSSLNVDKSYDETDLQIKLVGMNDESIVFVEESQSRVDGFYEYTQDQELKRRNEDVSIINEKYTTKNSRFYLGKGNEIYYLSDNVHGVVNLTENKFKQLYIAGDERNTNLPIIINGEHVSFEDNLGYPFVDENNYIYLPFRAILESIGAKIDWNNDTRAAIAEMDGVKIEVAVDKGIIFIDSKRLDNSTKALIIDCTIINCTIINGRIYLQATDAMEAVMREFGYKLVWDGKTLEIKKQ